MKFTDLCIKNNVRLLQRDMNYILKKIKDIKKQRRKHIMRLYVETWVDVLPHYDDPNTAQEMRRLAANSYLSSAT